MLERKIEGENGMHYKGVRDYLAKELKMHISGTVFSGLELLLSYYLTPKKAIDSQFHTFYFVLYTHVLSYARKISCNVSLSAKGGTLYLLQIVL